MNLAPERRGTVTTVQTAMTTSSGPLSQALALWKPWAQLPPGSEVRQAIEDFLMATTCERRCAALERGNPLFRLHNIYRELEILRADPGEKAREFSTLLATASSDLQSAVRGSGSPGLLALLQQCFEFGRAATHPKYEAVRLCLLEMWRLDAGGPSMKYALYPNGIVNSGAGKTHEEMAREFVALGYGGGLPQAGGQIFRTGALTFTFDIGSTAFRGSVQPANVVAAIQRWMRATGAEESNVRFTYRPSAGTR